MGLCRRSSENYLFLIHKNNRSQRRRTTSKREHCMTDKTLLLCKFSFREKNRKLFRVGNVIELLHKFWYYQVVMPLFLHIYIVDFLTHHILLIGIILANMYLSNSYWSWLVLTKGQLILKCLFVVVTFFQKTNENKSTCSKVKFIRSFFQMREHKVFGFNFH